MSNLADLTDRARLVFSGLVDNYLRTGAPIGSRNLADLLDTKLSPASIRATMAELEQHGLLYAPHVSAGRLPTESGLRLFIDGMLQVGRLSPEDQAGLAAEMGAEAKEGGMDGVLRRAVEGLSGLSACAGLVLAPNAERAVKHIEFVAVSDDQILVILVDETGQVENRLMPRPPGLPAATLREAGNWLNAHMKGRTLGELRRDSQARLTQLETELGSLAAGLVEQGLISWSGDTPGSNSALVAKSLIVHGQSHLLDSVEAMEDLDRIRQLFDDLDRQKDLIALLADAEQGEGVKIFIGAETPLFSLSGSSLIVSPYRDADTALVGVLGVIAPTRTNYARLIPMVDGTAQLVSDVLAGKAGS